MTGHYLDHASTSPLRPEAAAAMAGWLAGPFADPGRMYEDARTVRAAVEDARDQVATLLSVRPRQVVFTSGGTEAIVTAVWSATHRVERAGGSGGGSVLCAAVEHSAVREASARWADRVVELAVDRCGRIDPDALDQSVAAGDPTSPPPVLVHCQAANHEVGTVQPVGAIAARCAAAGIALHVDACAAAGHVPLDLASLGADYVSLSAHKLGGPPGVGALVVRPGLRLAPLLVGGQEERARRAGMENVVGIVGFGAAAGALAARGGALLADEAAAARGALVRLVDAATAVPGVRVVGDADPSGRVPHIVCLGVDGVEAEPIVLGLDRAGIAVHSGSACSSETLEPSPVLEAMGVDASHSLRLSVGWTTTDDDVAAFAPAFDQVVASLRALRPG